MKARTVHGGYSAESRRVAAMIRVLKAEAKRLTELTRAAADAVQPPAYASATRLMPTAIQATARLQLGDASVDDTPSIRRIDGLPDVVNHLVFSSDGNQLGRDAWDRLAPLERSNK